MNRSARLVLTLLSVLVSSFCGGSKGGGSPASPSPSGGNRANVSITSMTVEPSRNGSGYRYVIRMVVQNSGGASATLGTINFTMLASGQSLGTGSIPSSEAFTSPTLNPGSEATSSSLVLNDSTGTRQATSIAASLPYSDSGGSYVATRTADIAALPTSFALSGTVTESAPTASKRIAGARVEVADGEHRGKSAITNAEGNYRIEGLSGNLNVNVSAAGYESTGRGFDMSTDRTATFGLRPVFQMLSQEFGGTISGGETTICSDGVFTRPCKTVTVDIHHSGALRADLDWFGGAADLDLSLWNGSSLIAASRTATQSEMVSSNVSGGNSYQLKITYYTGSAIVTYRLRVSRPN